ncbi:LSM domain-containing protein [Drechmeria coniospora]|uniref:Small nuclear ribonucleoprotein Sm D3 n=1 Tax=Drechmeria coniospora TaxID=98403 RepID=A0A151GX48_DRECN|nr:LSM domain-containing protein [Drechmeria coniospora]KYK61676.1 LSM domain-containing protein [Drechmeria coniospora]
MTSTIGIPIKLLHEAQGHIITVELDNGNSYRGKLLDASDGLSCTAEDSMNVQLKDITVTSREGRVYHVDQVYIRGSHVRFFIIPDMLRNAPMFRARNVRGRGVGLARGRATNGPFDSGSNERPFAARGGGVGSTVAAFTSGRVHAANTYGRVGLAPGSSGQATRGFARGGPSDASAGAAPAHAGFAPRTTARGDSGR